MRYRQAAVTPSATERQAAIDEFGIAGTSADLAARGRPATCCREWDAEPTGVQPRLRADAVFWYLRRTQMTLRTRTTPVTTSGWVS